MGDSLLDKAIRSAVVFKQRHIGDVLLSTPAFRALRAACPEARITAAVNEGTEEMLAGNPDIDRIVVFRRSRKEAGGAARWREEARFLREVRAGRPDLAIQLTEGDRGAVLSLLSGARFRVGVAPLRRGLLGKKRIFTHCCPAPDPFRHAALRDLDVLAAAGIPAADRSLRFVFSPGDREVAMRKAKSAGLPEQAEYAVVQPTSRWTFKCWTEKGMTGVLRHFSQNGIYPVVTSGPDPAESTLAGRIVSEPGVPAVLLAGVLSLKELGALIASARLYIGVDSAPMHIAAAVGTPTVALFGPTGAYNWAPWEGIDWGYSPERPAGTRFVGRHAVVQKEWEEIRRGKEAGRKNAGMEEITLEEVVSTIDRILAAEAAR